MAEKIEPKPKAEQKDEWREHFGDMAKAQDIQERAERSAKFFESKKEARLEEKMSPEDREAQKELEEERASVQGAMAQKEGEKKQIGGQEDFIKWLGLSVAEKPRESAVANIEKIGKTRSEKAANFLAGGIEKGIAHLAALDKWGVLAFKGAGKLAVEAGGILAGIGLSPLIAIEEVGREVGGRTKLWWEAGKEKSTIKEIGKFEKIQPKSGEGVIATHLEYLRDRARLAKEEADKARNNLSYKGKVATFLSKLPFYKRFAE